MLLARNNINFIWTRLLTKKEAPCLRSQRSTTTQLSTAVWGSGCLECSGLSIPCKLGQKYLKFLPMRHSLSLNPSLSQIVFFCFSSTHTHSVLKISAISVKHDSFTPSHIQSFVFLRKSLFKFFSCSLLNASHQVYWGHSREQSCDKEFLKPANHSSAFYF